MIKILQIRRNTSGGYDGTDNYCRQLCRMFADDGECQVLPVCDIPQLPSLFNYSYATDVLREYISKADIIHINGYTAWGTLKALLLAHKMGKKVVYTAHWHPFECLRRPLPGKLFFNLCLKSVIKKCADVVTTINNEDTDFFKGFFPDVVRIPHSYLGEIREPERKQKDMILFVGRINDQVKGFDHILAIPKNKYDIHCVGVGEVPVQRQDITQHVNISDAELDSLYSKASLVVIPSRYEAFSYVAIEAFMHNTPVVMSDRVRIADYLDGINGYSVFKYGDTEEFVTSIERTIGVQVDSKKIYEIFSVQRVRSMYKQLYISL